MYSVVYLFRDYAVPIAYTLPGISVRDNPGCLALLFLGVESGCLVRTSNWLMKDVSYIHMITQINFNSILTVMTGLEVLQATLASSGQAYQAAFGDLHTPMQR
jgi:hypothetical protein